MKKLFITVAIAMSSVVAFANNHDNGFRKDVKNERLNEMFYGEHFVNDTIDNKTIELSCVRFYDIDRLVIMNDKGEYIKVVNDKNEVVIESRDSIDLELPGGNYFVYSTCHHLSALYR